MKNKISFFYNNYSSFIKKDFEMLSKNFKVSKNDYNSVKDSDLVFTWFAGLSSFNPIRLAKKYKKPSIVIVGGYDASGIPEYNFGVYCSWWRKIIANYIYRNTSRILTVDESLKCDILINSKLNIEKKIFTVPTGYDSDYWKPNGKKDNMVLSVGNVNKETLWRKGFATFIETAKLLPKYKFILAGGYEIQMYDKLFPLPENIILTGYLSDNKLLKMYQKSGVYCQLSRHEGLPNTLCEAMLCECVPVGTHYYGIPTAIGDSGIYCDYGDENSTATAIKKAMCMNGSKARERIKVTFSTKRRLREILKHIEEII